MYEKEGKKEGEGVGELSECSDVLAVSCWKELDYMERELDGDGKYNCGSVRKES